MRQAMADAVAVARPGPTQHALNPPGPFGPQADNAVECRREKQTSCRSTWRVYFILMVLSAAGAVAVLLSVGGSTAAMAQSAATEAATRCSRP
jgi:hypothetical protein